MSRPSLVNRLSLALAALSFLAAAAIGYVLYERLADQLGQRDDIALITRVDQVRTLLRDEDVMDLINTKPQLFANMLGNSEALLVLKFPGHAPLIEINPGQSTVPEIEPVPAGQHLMLDAVRHTLGRNDVPFIYTSAFARTTQGKEIQVISGKLMIERTRLLRDYRNRIVFMAAVGGLLTALLAYVLARRALAPVAHLAQQTASIGVRNLSQRIDTELAPRELLPLIESFNGMLARLDTGFSQLSQVSADMAHDLRTPVNNMLGQIEVAFGQKRSNEYYEKLLGSTFEELQRLSRMSDSMLFLARAEHADHAIERKTLDVREEMERVCEYFEGPACDRNVKLVFEGKGTVWADPDLLRRALANLLSNAVRYANEDSEIVLTAAQDGAGTAFTVENKGPTITTEHLGRIFDRFYRADPSRAGSSESSGLGLSIVRSIMSLHQGSWRAASDNGVTRFVIAFPDVSTL
ncbi:heavy metal sensor histidine kinase [Pseudoduganella sp. RAF53_2]|uniref:heavy metal sensor histidine kinase n=1 Tax=unclassified Pseudoduganella TaxID=2637179 RepID=UPI003F9A057B